MNSDKALSQLAKHSGIVTSFRNLAGENRPTAPETKLALLRACGWQLDNDAMILEAWKMAAAQKRERLLPEEIVTVSGLPFELNLTKSGSWSLVLEGAQGVFAEGRSDENMKLPALPMGVHQLSFRHGKQAEKLRIISAPTASPSVVEMTKYERIWGVNLALYGLHSTRNPDLGDYSDLAKSIQAFAAHGADFCGINPVHAMGWHSENVISPYSPSHRGFLSSAHLSLNEIEPCSNASAELIAKWRNTASLNQSGHVDYAQYAEHHRPILRSLYGDFERFASNGQRTAFVRFCQSLGSRLRDFANFEGLSAEHGCDWRQWPSHQRSPSNRHETDELAFHMWLQWHAEAQLEKAQQTAGTAGMKLGLYLDLAVGARRDGAEAWVEQDSIADQVSIGAPPDHLSPAGQNWNLCAYAPRKLAATNYEAFRNILARNMRHCGVLRIDHVLGLNRSFWIPDDGSPGGYIKQNFDALLALIKIEAQRNQTVIIGEDLGLVPNGFRKSLAESGLYSYSVLQYEKTASGSFRKPAKLQPQSLACFGTHDTPTLEGFSQGRDIDWWEKLGWIDGASATASRKDRQQECEQLLALAPTGKCGAQRSLNGSVHDALAASPVAMVAVQLDDIEQEVEAQNLPGTIGEHPNWRRRAVTSVEELSEHRGLNEIAQLMSDSGRGGHENDRQEKHNEQ